MKTNIININSVQTMTSLEIAELTGKQHKHVMEAIRKMEAAWVNVAGSNFRLGSYKDANGQLRPCYQLTKTECLYIATKFNDEARAKLVLRWEELEDIVARAHEIMGRTLEALNSGNELCLTATQVARSWGMDVVSFNNLLAGMGIQQRRGGRWHLSEELAGRHLAEVRSFFFYSLRGKARMHRYLVWTPEGVDFLNMAVRKLPREVTANVQLQFNF